MQNPTSEDFSKIVLTALKERLKNRWPEVNIQLFRLQHKLVINKLMGIINYHIAIYDLTIDEQFPDKRGALYLKVKVQERTVRDSNSRNSQTRGGRHCEYSFWCNNFVNDDVYDEERFKEKLENLASCFVKFINVIRVGNSLEEMPPTFWDRSFIYDEDCLPWCYKTKLPKTKSR